MKSIIAAMQYPSCVLGRSKGVFSECSGYPQSGYPPQSSRFHKKDTLNWMGIKSILAAAGSWAALLTASVVLSPALVILTPTVYSVAEAVFAVYSYMKWRSCSAEVVHFVCSREEAWSTFKQTLDVLTSHYDVEHWLAEWFKGAPFHSIYRDNVLELMANAMLHMDRQKADAEGYATDLHAMVDSLEAALGTNLPLGYNPKISFYQHTSEPIPHFYRPLVVYAAFEFMAWMNHNMLRAAGYSKHTFPVHSAGTTRSNGDVQRAPCCNESAAATAASSVVYFTANMPAADTACSTCGDTLCSSSSSSNSKAAAGSVKLSACTVRGAECDCECTPERARIHRHASTSSHANAAGDDERPIPIVFLHGVGMGLLPYLRLLVALAATGAPIIAIECKHVSQRWASSSPGLCCLAAEVQAVLARHGYSRASFIAHSFGSALCSLLLQAEPSPVAHLTLLDPICFHMFVPRLLKNFLYRRVSGWGSAVMDLLMLGPARELHCTALLCRRLQWSRVNAWEHHVPAGTLVAMAERDELVDVAGVSAWLRARTPARVWVMPGLAHAQICLAFAWQDKIIADVMQRTHSVKEQQQEAAAGFASCSACLQDPYLTAPCSGVRPFDEHDPLLAGTARAAAAAKQRAAFLQPSALAGPHATSTSAALFSSEAMDNEPRGKAKSRPQPAKSHGLTALDSCIELGSEGARQPRLHSSSLRLLTGRSSPRGSSPREASRQQGGLHSLSPQLSGSMGSENGSDAALFMSTSAVMLTQALQSSNTGKGPSQGREWPMGPCACMHAPHRHDSANPALERS